MALVRIEATGSVNKSEITQAVWLSFRVASSLLPFRAALIKPGIAAMPLSLRTPYPAPAQLTHARYTVFPSGYKEFLPVPFKCHLIIFQERETYKGKPVGDS